jgi:peptide/nickel transport system ATP-binding protein/oligopeptide transport system ATP-binding protein
MTNPDHSSAPLLECQDLIKHFRAKDGQGTIQAVNGVGLSLDRGETLGIVGESGCGKSTLARLLLRLIEPTAGKVRFDGEDLLSLPQSKLRTKRRDLQLIFQDPYASLDPRLTIRAILAEPLAIHGVGDRRQRRERVVELLETVGLESESLSRYPHEFSGGQRQRIGIARAIALHPKLIVADEPVSALDVSIQSQILELLLDLKDRLGLSYIFISHDLAVVEHVSGYGKSLPQSQPPLYESSDFSRAATRSRPAAGTYRALGRYAEPGKPAPRLPVPYPLPQGHGPLSG